MFMWKSSSEPVSKLTELIYLFREDVICLLNSKFDLRMNEDYNIKILYGLSTGLEIIVNGICLIVNTSEGEYMMTSGIGNPPDTKILLFGMSQSQDLKKIKNIMCNLPFNDSNIIYDLDTFL